MYIYIYIYICLSEELFVASLLHAGLVSCTLSPPTKSSGFRGFDSSKLLILKVGNSHVRRI